MDVNYHTRLVVLLAFAGILAILIPDGQAVAQTVASVQDITTVHPTLLKGKDTNPGFADSLWLILLALGGFLYLVNNRSV